MRPSHLLALASLLVTLAGCSRGAETPKAAARAFLEASLRGDERAARKVVVAPGASGELLDLAVHARLARSRARQRVVEAAVKRFGPEAAEAFPLPRLVADDLEALEAAPLEAGDDTAVIRVGRRPLVAKRVGFAWWKGWKIEIQALREQRERMKAVAEGAEAAADATIRGIEQGEYPDARAAAGALLRHRLDLLGARPADH